MLLQNEITFVESKMLELSQKHDLQKYANELKESKEYKDFLTRLSWGILRAACGVNYICSLYDKYIYFRHYGGWSEKMSFENFNFYVNKLQEKNERIYFIVAISYKSIEGKTEEIAKENNINYSPYKIY